MDRPIFDDIETYFEFSDYYWYRKELQTICKSLGLEYVGSKIELYNIIKAYFEGIKILHKPKNVLKPKTFELTLDTSLIDCAFTCGSRFRDFFARVTGDKNFKFTADMVATAKEVKKNNDKSFTLGDLLNVKLNKKTYAKYDKSSCQWNKYLKDFCADRSNDVFTDKFKAAVFFWSLLRQSNLPKVYTREFVEQNKDKII